MDIKDKSWVSASAIKNHMMNDPIIDWLELTKQYESDENKLEQDIFAAGLAFEGSVLKYLETNFTVVKIAQDGRDLYKCDKYLETIKAMEDCVEIIYQAVLINKKNKTGGVCDFLIRSDVFNKLVSKNGGVHFINSRDLFYVVVDTKLSKLSLKRDGLHLSDNRKFSYYKGQLYVYLSALNTMQNYVNHCAYIIGKGWEYTKQGEKISGANIFERIGKIDYTYEDAYVIEHVKDAIEWIRKVRSEGRDWCLFPPTVGELRPNMSLSGGKWDRAKDEIAVKQNDISQLYMCGHDKRKHALAKGVESWKECDSEILGARCKRVCKSIDNSIEVNLEAKVDFLPKRLADKDVIQETPVELYIDLETFTVPGKFDDVTRITKARVVTFIIGCGFVRNGEWEYKNYVIDDKSLASEKNIFQRFYEDTKDLENYKIYTWGTTEKNIFGKMLPDSSSDLFSDGAFVDLLKLVRSESFSIKGCFGYSLKDVAKAMHSLGFIDTIWREESTVKNGYDALKVGEEKFLLEKDVQLKDVCEYNEVDCKVMWDIVKFLRKNL